LYTSKWNTQSRMSSDVWNNIHSSQTWTGIHIAERFGDWRKWDSEGN
jgi:hypothetical protein